eukprot:362989-Chlamydomonas_euryale.AAC.11
MDLAAIGASGGLVAVTSHMSSLRGLPARGFAMAPSPSPPKARFAQDMSSFLGLPGRRLAGAGATACPPAACTDVSNGAVLLQLPLLLLVRPSLSGEHLLTASVASLEQTSS